MTNSTYRAILGGLLIAFLYFHLNTAILGMILILLLEGITNLQIPMLVNRIRGDSYNLSVEGNQRREALDRRSRFGFSSERAWRLVVGVMLAISFLLSDQSYLWLFPWFMGFAIFGAGISNVCPVLLVIKWVGFR